MKTETSEVKEHSEFGGSQAERIINCPGSVVLSRGIPNKSNAASDAGTEAHACLEFFILNRKLLKKPFTREALLDTAAAKWDEDMIDHALVALTYIEGRMGPGSELFAEQKLDTSKFTTANQSSTLDVAIAAYRARSLIIMDYKYGKHPVEVDNNSQLIYYALGMLIKLKGWNKFDRIECVIIQPRAYHKDGPVREWTLSMEDAVKWGKKFRKVVKVALAPNPPLKYGDKWCFFCLANSKCPVIKQRKYESDFSDIEE